MLCENTDHIKNAQGISSGFIKADCLDSHRFKMQIIITVIFRCHVSLPAGKINFSTVSKRIQAPVKILYISVVALVMVIAFGGGLSLSRVLWKSASSRSNMKPKAFLNRLGNGSSGCFVGFKCFGNTSCSFRVAFIWMHFPSFSFH